MKVMLACPNDSPLVASISEKGGISVPLGLAYIGAYIRDLSDIELVGFDNNALKLSPAEYREVFRSETPDIVAISILTATVYTTWEMARIIKEILPNAVVVVGGMHCSALPENTMEEPAIDYGVMGEGEEAFRELIMAIRDKQDSAGIKNLVFRSHGRVIVNPRRPRMENLDSIPFPNRDLFDNSKYSLNVNRRATSGRSTTILTSRGCPYGCVFCSKSVYGRDYKQRSPGNVIAEIKFLEQSGYGEVLIVDDTFTVDREWVLEFCRLYAYEGLQVRWNCHARVNTIDEEIVRAMKAANCTGMAFGIESGNPAMLERIDKCITLEQAYSAVELCRKHGISSLCSYIFGHPGDTRATMKDTLRTSLTLDSDFANFGVLIPMPGSKIFDELQAQGRVDSHWDRYLGHARKTMSFSLCECSPTELHAMQRMAFRRFYFRPRYVWHKIRQVRSLTALWGLICGAYIIMLYHIQALFGKHSSQVKGG